MKKILSIGMNYTNSQYYLPDCETDAERMGALYESAGYESDVIKGSFTPAQFESKITAIKAEGLDQLVVYYSGHGMQLPNVEGEEKDKWEEALCLWNGTRINTLLDHDFAAMIKGSAANVTVIMDCCHSGGMSKNIMPSLRAKSLIYNESIDRSYSYPRTKSIKEYKEGINYLFASVENQVSYSTGKGGAFTLSFLETVKTGNVEIESIISHVQKDVTFQRANFIGNGKKLAIINTMPILEQLEKRGEAMIPGVGTIYIKNLWGKNRLVINPDNAFFKKINS